MHGFCPLSSGSKGNCTYFGTAEAKILIDVGISMRALERKLGEIDVDITEIDAILITHEHSDHIKGLNTLSKRMNIPVFANMGTAKGIVPTLERQPPFKIFATGEPFSFADMEIFPFCIQHDTLDPVAFVVEYEEWKFGFCTDLGLVTSTVQYHLQNCDYLVVEANHQPSMVYASLYPDYLKKRIMGPSGHLSNEDCAALLVSIWSSKLKHVHLAHLSEECNHPDVALQTIRDLLKRHGKSVPVQIAWQHEISDAIILPTLTKMKEQY